MRNIINPHNTIMDLNNVMLSSYNHPSIFILDLRGLEPELKGFNFMRYGIHPLYVKTYLKA